MDTSHLDSKDNECKDQFGDHEHIINNSDVYYNHSKVVSGIAKELLDSKILIPISRTGAASILVVTRQ